MKKNRSRLTRSGARRLGDEYQDLIALELLIDWLEHSERYRWLRLEADEAGSLDDVVALRGDESIVVKQVKFSTNPELERDPWTWDKLLKQKKGKSGPLTSLLQKWFKSLETILKMWDLHEAALVSNRRAAPDIAHTLSLDGLVDFDKIADPKTRQAILQQLGGEAHVREFFSRFRFRLNEPNLPDLEEALQRRFYRLGGTEQGWLNLKDAVPDWASYRHAPRPNGEITLRHVRKVALWYQLQALPQRFEIPSDYVLPSEDLHENLVRDLLARKQACFVLSASPGTGKSTYSSYFYQELRKQEVPVIRHHYFLSLSDQTWSQRLDHQRAAESLMHDLERDYDEALAGRDNKNANPNELGKWVEACGRYYAKRGKVLVVIIDGLDHVWREQQSITELDKLLRFLLPAREGVVIFLATQPVDDRKLPRCLLRAAPRQEWKQLPFLDEHAVERWLRHHESEIRQVEQEEVPDYLLELLAQGFYSKRQGHPLHLRYTLKALQEQNLLVTGDNIARLPGCPHENITTYYEELWYTLADESCEILHLLAACKFPWPRQGILDCLDPQGHAITQIRRTLRQVEHLLIQDALGLRPFHSSLLVFVEGLSEHADYAEPLKRRALEWLRHRAPEHWKWAYEWTLEADLGNEQPLRDGPNRQWVLEAIAKRHSAEEIKAILSRSTWCALQHNDLPRAIEVGLLRDYCYNVFTFQKEVIETLLYPQLVSEDEPYLHARLRARSHELTDGELAILAEAEANRGHIDEVRRYFNELVHRSRTNRSRRAGGIDAPWQTRVIPMLKVVARIDDPNLAKVIDWAVRNRKRGRTSEMLSIFCDQLRIRKDAQQMRRILRVAIGLHSDVTTAEAVEELDTELLHEEQAIILRHAVLLALEEGLDFDHIIKPTENTCHPFVIIYALLRKIGHFSSGEIQFPKREILSLKRYEHYERSDEMQDFFYQSFFCLLANHLSGQSERNNAWLQEVGHFTWPCQFLHRLNEICADLAILLLAEFPLSFAWFYEKMKGIARPTWADGRDELSYANLAASAVLDIGLDILILSQAVSGHISISQSDLESAFASDYCDPQAWMQVYIARRRTWLGEEAIKWVLQQQAAQLATLIEEFPQRAASYNALASVAALHNLHDEAQRFIYHTADNLLTHGNRKDMLLNEVVDMVQICHQMSQKAEVSDKARSYLLQLAPAIAKIKQYTDGDETSHLPRLLADVLAQIAPDLLRVYYQWLCRIEEYEDALHTFRVFLKTVDLSEPINLAIAKTAVDEQGLRLLAERAEAGDEGAQVALSSLLELLGQNALLPSPDSPKSSQPSSDYKKEEPLPLAKYPPDHLEEYIATLRRQHSIYVKERVEEWTTFWVKRGHKEKAFNALKQMLERGVNLRNLDTVFDLAFSLYGQAYANPWLVQAHRKELGWYRYFTDKEKAVRRWQIIKQHYPNQWFDFLRDTIGHAMLRSGLSIDHKTFVRIVEYCYFMDQPHLAEQLMAQMVASALELVSPLALPTPEWIVEVSE